MLRANDSQALQRLNSRHFGGSEYDLFGSDHRTGYNGSLTMAANGYATVIGRAAAASTGRPQFAKKALDMHARSLTLAAVFLTLVGITTADEPSTPPTPPVKIRHPNAAEVFNNQATVLFQDNFSSGQFAKWRFSENANYQIAEPNSDRIRIVAAPGLPNGRKAVRFCVERAPDSFRSEISLPHEPGFQDRWYGLRLQVDKDWVFDSSRGADIVMQWHAIPGNGKPTNPNLEISVLNTRWHVRQTYGDPPDHKQGWQKDLDEPVKRGEWSSWVIHAKWSPDDDGLIQIWKEEKLVVERKGCNVYSTIGVKYTPYLKTGIYRPEWHLDKEGKREAFEQEQPLAKTKVVYVTDVKVGGEQATRTDVAPPQ